MIYAAVSTHILWVIKVTDTLFCLQIVHPYDLKYLQLKLEHGAYKTMTRLCFEYET